MLNWGWYTDPNTFRVFFHCLLKANWKPGEWKGYHYERGQFITSLPTVGNELNMSVQSVRTALSHLKSTGEITEWHDNKVRIITVNNYDDYQAVNRQRNRQPTDGQQATNRQPTGNQQQYKNIKNIKEDIRTQDSVSETDSSWLRDLI